MSAEPAYDTTRLQALQARLLELNAAALADGLLASVGRNAPYDAPAINGDGSVDEPAADAQVEGRGPRRRRGRAAASRLLALASRADDDDSPDVAGTCFTEAGIVRLLAHLRRRGGATRAWPRFLARLERVLARPVPQGQHVVAGVSLERLQICYRQLLEIESFGLVRFTSRRAARRGRNQGTGALMIEPGAAPQPAPAVEKEPT